MTDTTHTIITMDQRPDLISAAQRLPSAAWPTFMMQDNLVERYWMRLYEVYPEYQFVLVEPDTERIVAMGNSVPLVWDGRPEDLPAGGIDWILPAAFDNPPPFEGQGICQFALQIVVDPGLRGRALSGSAVQAMLDIGRRHGCRSLFAPVRPNQKHMYPLTPIERYIHWTNNEGLPFDAWMRVHARLGAKTVGVCGESMRITGTIAQWENWIGLSFPESGPYVVPLALVPVQMDRERDLGLYIEPNVWMQHVIMGD
ncbi:MAG: GNAT family N-acetyltransferase [candidate division Zixibacteria bacterium]|jgi:GNAT superfamily N-acetyltransferase|nr:GNAT family N-acetyltransferase [candidate division Zixibacteria bacterium]